MKTGENSLYREWLPVGGNSSSGHWVQLVCAVKQIERSTPAHSCARRRKALGLRPQLDGRVTDRSRLRADNARTSTWANQPPFHSLIWSVFA